MLPNFLVIGAAKSGTTSLYYYLKEHPEIYMSPLLEPKFFSFWNQRDLVFNGKGDQEANSHVITNLEAYKNLFSECANEKAIGEISPCYLYYENSAKNIYKLLPNVKIIVILRNPSERAHSNFCHLLSARRENLYNFSEALKIEQKRIINNWEYFWRYKSQGFYYQKLKNYFKLFNSEQIKVILYEDYKSDCQSVLSDIFKFLEVNPDFESNVEKRYNITESPTGPFLNSLIKLKEKNREAVQQLIPPSLRTRIFKSIKKLDKPAKSTLLGQDVKAQLINDYKEDILKLQQLLNRDLSHWLLP
ncbi:MAG: sulfotransferase [Cyanobacteria bacterium RI_101]|nr:sulfotransferase [Cyanobacteria bacterium RI_101]